MSALAPLLLAASGFTIFSLGTAHLVLTFRGNKLSPRDATLEVALKSV